MTKPVVKISDALGQQFKELRVVWFEASQPDDSALRALVPGIVAEAQSNLSENTFSGEEIGKLHMLAPWRIAFANQGIKPSQFRSSAEALYRRFVSGKYSSVGIPIVDLYNAVSAGHQVPIGAYDIPKLAGTEILLRFARAGDRFDPLGGKPNDFPLNERVPVYAVGSIIICWCFNHRDSRETCVDQQSEKILFVSEAIESAQYLAQDAAIDEIRRTLSSVNIETSDPARVRAFGS